MSEVRDDAWSQLLEPARPPEAASARLLDGVLRDLSEFEGDVLRADLHPERPSCSAIAAALTGVYGRLVTAEVVREHRTLARNRLCEVVGPLTADEKRLLLERIADRFGLPSGTAPPRWLAGPRPRRRGGLLAGLLDRRRQRAESVKPG